MRWLLLFCTLLTSSVCWADELTEVLRDVNRSQQFAESMTRSIIPIWVRPQNHPLVDSQTVGATPALAVVIAGPRLVTSGLLVEQAASIAVRSPSGRIVVLRRWERFGTDGALASITLTDLFLRAELEPLDTAERASVGDQLHVLTVAGIDGPFPVVALGAVLKRLEPPWDMLLATDVRFMLGAPLLTADRKLAGLVFRPHPEEAKLAIAVSGDEIGAWFRPAGPPVPDGSPAR